MLGMLNIDQLNLAVLTTPDLMLVAGEYFFETVPQIALKNSGYGI